jgi:hypothetical protein
MSQRDKPRQRVVATRRVFLAMGAAGFIRLVRRNFMITLPEKRNDEKDNTYQCGVPENK